MKVYEVVIVTELFGDDVVESYSGILHTDYEDAREEIEKARKEYEHSMATYAFITEREIEIW